MKIIKRNGRSVQFNPNKILRRIKEQANGLKIDPTEVFVEVTSGIADEMKTIEVDNLIAEIASGKIILHPDYSTFAAKIIMTKLQKDLKFTITEIAEMGVESGILNETYLKKVKKYGEKLESEIDPERDFIFDYFGLKTLADRYLLKVNHKLVERPQQMYARIALTVGDDNYKSIKETYDLLSTHWYTHATPTMMNSGRKDQQLLSCYLVQNEGDSLEGLLNTQKDIATLSKFGGGIGLAVSNVRAKGSDVRGIGKSNGLMPMMRSYNELMKWFNQLGMRKGSCALYLEPWHKDVFTFLDVRKNNGAEELRARDLFTALWIPDIFMERVKANEDWYLFCPNEVKKVTGIDLQLLYGQNFKDAYLSLVDNENVSKKQIKAQDLWIKIIENQMETGTPYIGYKDHVNNKNQQSNIGPILSSNLCIEIVEHTAPNEVAACNLASVALPKFVDEETKTFDFQHLHKIMKQVVKNTNNVIDVSFYPVDKAQMSNVKHRPIAVGVQGLADTFTMMDLSFTCDEAKKLNKDIFETMYHAALEASMEMAKKNEPYSTYEGSPISKGQFQWKMWGLTEEDLSGKWDWRKLESQILKHGVRNSLLIALMPTASSALIMGNNECFEPFVNNTYSRNTITGTFQVVNKHLVKDLEKHNLWEKGIGKIIVANNGSINKINEALTGENRIIVEEFLAKVPQLVKDKYRTIWELSMKDIINMAASRAAFVDQTQSMNLFMAQPTVPKLTSMHFYSWQQGLKTGMYYLRSKPAMSANATLGLDLSDINQKPLAVKPTDSPFDCFGCSA